MGKTLTRAEMKEIMAGSGTGGCNGLVCDGTDCVSVSTVQDSFCYQPGDYCDGGFCIPS